MAAALSAFVFALWFFLGAAVFSFLEVVVCRLPAHRSVVKGRSMCDSCGKTLSAAELVPVFSWLFQKGRCRACGAKLSAWYPISECLGGGCCVLCGVWFGASANGPFGLSWRAAFWFLAFCLLWADCRIDAATGDLPDVFAILLALLGVLALWLLPEVSLAERLIGAVCVSLPMFVLAFLTGGFGGGDIKLTAATGLLLGWQQELTSFAFAVFLGGSYGIWLLATGQKTRKQTFAFGPFLGAGVLLAVLFGSAVREWYFAFL